MIILAKKPVFDRECTFCGDKLTADNFGVVAATWCACPRLACVGRAIMRLEKYVNGDSSD